MWKAFFKDSESPLLLTAPTMLKKVHGTLHTNTHLPWTKAGLSAEQPPGTGQHRCFLTISLAWLQPPCAASWDTQDTRVLGVQVRQTPLFVK